MRLKPNEMIAGCLSLGLLLCSTSCTTVDPADTNKDGVLSVPELESAMVDAIIEYSDADGDGQLTFAEWQAANAGAKASLFRKRDLNGDGKLDRDEAVKSTQDSDTWDQLIAKIDLNGDGKIDESEKATFREAMAKADDDDQVNKLIDIAKEK
jgi:Ca2+-binding EF-hand superfamily protein